MPRQKTSAREALRKLSDAELLLLLGHQDASVRAAAAEALGKIGSTEAGPDLLALFRKSDEPDFVRDTCAYALARLAYKPALEALISALSDPAPTVRICVVAALLSLDTFSLYERVAFARNTEQNEEVKMAMDAFLRSATRSAVRETKYASEPSSGEPTPRDNPIPALRFGFFTDRPYAERVAPIPFSRIAAA